MPEQAIVCRQCGLANPPGNNFCGRCGTHLGTRQPAPVIPLRPRGGEDARNRRNAQIIYAITAFFILSCLILTVVVIVWRP